MGLPRGEVPRANLADATRVSSLLGPAVPAGRAHGRRLASALGRCSLNLGGSQHQLSIQDLYEEFLQTESSYVHDTNGQPQTETLTN